MQSMYIKKKFASHKFTNQTSGLQVMKVTITSTIQAQRTKEWTELLKKS